MEDLGPDFDPGELSSKREWVKIGNGSFGNVYKASLVSMMAGSDFIKTSTGKEKENATLPVSLTMVRAVPPLQPPPSRYRGSPRPCGEVREYYEATGVQVGFKPAGGISKAKDAVTYLSMMKEELGDEWCTS